MTPHDYCFESHWRVTSSCAEVYRVLHDGEALPRWWPSVYLSARRVSASGPDGTGAAVDFHTKGWLPYTLRWRSTITHIDFPHGFRLAASGDFEGAGAWTFRQEGADVLIRFDWRIRAEKPLLRRWSFLLRAMFEANHRWAMRQGEISLGLELERRRAAAEGRRGPDAEPPRPTFVRSRLPALSVPPGDARPTVG